MTPAQIVARLRSEISALPIVDERHARSTRDFIAALDRLDRPLDEDADVTHVTASTIVAGSRGTILHLHKRLGLWLQPGGHIEAGETPWDAALRETLEETGLTARHAGGAPALVHVDVHDGGRGHTHLDLRYLVDVGDADPVPPEGESPDVRWFSWDEAIDVADPGLVSALRAVRPLAP